MHAESGDLAAFLPLSAEITFLQPYKAVLDVDAGQWAAMVDESAHRTGIR